MRAVISKVIVSLIIVLTLSGCYLFRDEEYNNKSGCIPPLTNFSYSLSENNGRLNSPGSTLPGKPWKEEAVIPKPSSTGDHAQSYLSFIRNTKNSSEIWIINHWNSKTDNLSQGKYTMQIYNTASHTWREMPLTLEYPLAEIVQVYLDGNGKIWARASSEIGNARGYINGYTKNPFLFATLNEDNGNFQYLDISQSIPIGPVSFDGRVFWIFQEHGNYYKLEPKDLKNTPKGSVTFDGIELWRFEGDYAFYSLDPNSLELKKHTSYQSSQLAKSMSLSNDIIIADNSLAFAHDGSFYFLNEIPKESYSWRDMYLFRYSPVDETFDALPISLENQPLFRNLFMDRNGNLWLSDYGWMDTEHIWHQIIRSPLFITDKTEGEPAVWDNPYIVLNSSDGQMWFGATNGMVSLNPEKGEWCWFTTYQSNIVEDASHNLWMIADGKLYKYPLKP